MKAHAGSVFSSAEKCLDVCYLQSVPKTDREEHTLYYMTLLAYAAVHKQKGMVKYLLEKGASKYVPDYTKSISSDSSVPSRITYGQWSIWITTNSSLGICLTL